MKCAPATRCQLSMLKVAHVGEDKENSIVFLSRD